MNIAMGMYDSILLLEHIVCPNCRTDADTEVPIDTKPKEVDLGAGEPLKIIRLHDCKGGLREFQIESLVEPSLERYSLPGRMPPERVTLDCLDEGMPIYSHCNFCETAWSGRVMIEVIDKKNVFASELRLEGMLDESTLMYQDKICTHPLYDIEVEQDLDFTAEQGKSKTQLIVRPKIDACLKYLACKIKGSIKKGSAYKKAVEELAEKTRQSSGYEGKIQRLIEIVNEKTKGTDLLIETFHPDKRMRIILSEALLGSAERYMRVYEPAVIALAFLHEDIDPEHAKSTIESLGLGEKYAAEKDDLTKVKNKEKTLFACMLNASPYYLEKMLEN